MTLDVRQTQQGTKFHGVPRLTIVDLARGVAILVMVVYHFSWDLSYFHMIPVDVNGNLGWRIFARSIASSFLFLVGFSLVLAHANKFRPVTFTKRLAIIVLAASGVSLATWWIFPDSFVFFGILHNIALSSVLALPFVWMPVSVTVGAALLVIGLPIFVSSSLFNAPELIWLGLYTVQPVSNDYVPIFPWTGAVLLGVAAAHILVRNDRLIALLARPILNWPGRMLDLAGRHSLPIYLVHQPVLFGALYLVVMALGPFTPTTPTPAFFRTCEVGCTESGYGEAMCVRYCACIGERMVPEGLWLPLAEDAIQPHEATRLAELATECNIETLN